MDDIKVIKNLLKKLQTEITPYQKKTMEAIERGTQRSIQRLENQMDIEDANRFLKEKEIEMLERGEITPNAQNINEENELRKHMQKLINEFKRK